MVCLPQKLVGLACCYFLSVLARVVDLGVMVPAQKIIAAAISEKAGNLL